MEAACEAGPGAGGAPGGTKGGTRASADPHRSMVEEMLACPCVADLRAGFCGQAFEGAFECYLEQTEPAEAQGGGAGGAQKTLKARGAGAETLGRARRPLLDSKSAWLSTRRSLRSSRNTPSENMQKSHNLT